MTKAGDDALHHRHDCAGMGFYARIENLSPLICLIDEDSSVDEWTLKRSVKTLSPYSPPEMKIHQPRAVGRRAIASLKRRDRSTVCTPPSLI